MEIKNEVENKKFTTQVEGGEARIAYRRGAGNSYDLVSTLVPYESRGKNIADQLVREALKTAKQEGVSVIATCPYVKHWFQRHPEESSILFQMENEQRPSM